MTQRQSSTNTEHMAANTTRSLSGISTGLLAVNTTATQQLIPIHQLPR